MKSIVMLSGPVGAGKTAVAAELVANATGPTVYIEGDKFWFFIAKSGAGRGRHKDFRTIMWAMTAAAVPYAVADYEVILDFSIPPWFLETARKVVARKEVPLDYVILRPSQAVCSERAAARAEGVITDYAPYVELYKSFDGFEGHMISDDPGTASEVAAQIRDGLSAGKFRINAS